jgi:L-fucono-1,5-lactonase
MQVIDTHQHFWKYDPVRDSWITDEMRVIQRDFMPDDLLPVFKANGIDGCILVQTDQSEADNEFQLSNAAQHDFIKGIVGWVDFEASTIEERLELYSQYNIMKGFRHVLQGEPQRDFMLRPKFKQGISLLSRHNFAYDILIFPDQLKYTAEFAAGFPNQRFVINHIAKPNIREHEIEEWKKDMEAVAKFENVSCKISGMLGEKKWSDWKDADFVPYFDVIVEAFGTKRIMFGSDWPVCLVAGSYEKVFNLVKKYFSSFSKHEQGMFFGGNAIDFYNLGK